MSDAKKMIAVSPREESLLELSRLHPSQNITIFSDLFDTTSNNVYLSLNEKEERYKELEVNDQIIWLEAERFLAAYIAAHDGVPVEDVTPEYSKRTLKESQKQFQKKMKEKEYANPEKIAKRLIRQAALDLA